MTDFAPALSLSEAEARMFALVGTAPLQTRGPKRALRALAFGVGLDMPVELENTDLAHALGDHLGVRVPLMPRNGGGYVPLTALNRLLLGAFLYFQTHDAPRPTALPDQFRGREWDWFVPARSKIEAVNRISALTSSGPEELGPGGKERKRVFVNLARCAGLPVDVSVSKVELGYAIAESLGVVWTDTCASTGYTITLEGLNVVLAGAERLFRRRGQFAVVGPVTEANQLLGILASEFGDTPWDGRQAIEQMRRDGYRQWRQTEWPGWYFEYRGLTAMHNAMGPQPDSGPSQKWGRTWFDYAHRFVWDLKAHSARGVYLPSGRRPAANSGAPLNDKGSIEECVAEVGLGLIMLSGNARYDEAGAFDAWHRRWTAPPGKEPTPSTSKNPRARKDGFEPLEVAAYRWNNLYALQAAVTVGALTIMNQGRQQPKPGEALGAPRRPKYGLNLRRANEWLLSSKDL